MELTTTSKRKKRKIKRRIKILVAIVILLAAGITYEQTGRYLDNKAYPPVGKLIDVNGHHMHIWAEGTGDVTVVFGVGYQIPSGYVDFYPLYNDISKYARVAVYDRPGYGWSDVTEAPRDIDTITKEIHQVLVQSGETPPYIFVAHSIASLEAIRFAQMYGEEVKGIILIDGSSPDMYTNMEELPSTTFAYKRTAMLKKAVSLINEAGIIRLLLNTAYPYESTILSTGRNRMPSVPDKVKEIDKALFLKAPNNKNQVGESDRKEDNALKVLENGYLGDIPLVIITSEYLNNYEDSKEAQANLLHWSTDSKQIVVEGAGHAVHWYSPEVINAEILDILQNK
ncbi:Pimeloyl-ACP methyl ester carboxylesterase [Evansella caseinilytica]|uniref:Pimeloyl-ACP methyl ester carboxylesterase n=1 Tax=Evansella caseinilytica TaxID=1503961 RepID=A0A1H3U7N5_9BACI|nr:alpha/beta hydrolase [Evansella caseinilytica]SDZ58476.1 Pimeloyl-ACP methyl ester carboxylesterase [Evansella caseinilytica]